MLNFIRVAAAVPRLEVADPAFNTNEIIKLYRQAAEKQSAAVVFPELSITGYSCGDLFEHPRLLDAAKEALKKLVSATCGCSSILIAGLPWLDGAKLYNTAAVCQNGKLLGIAVKKYLPEFRNNFEKRIFSPAESGKEKTVDFDGQQVLFAADPVFETPEFSFGIEFGSGLGSAASDAAMLANSGAQVIFTLGSSPETAASARRRREMVKYESTRLVAGYVYSGSGVFESSGEQLCSGHAVIAVNGELKAESERFSRKSELIFADLNPSWLDISRRSWSNFNDARYPDAVRIKGEKVPVSPDLGFAQIDSNPFIPHEEEQLKEHCREIFNIQTAALAKRFEACHAKRMIIGLSGGLDSTLALLVAVKCCDLLSLPRETVYAVTMPGFGTSGRTRGNAEILAESSGVFLRTIPINDAVEQHFRDIGHDPESRNVVYENSQARERTQILMDIANEENGIVIGTGDLSEIALGWSTFNGDHMSMYCVNCDVPKTLMRSMVEFAATESSAELAAALRDICATPVSPELLPGAQHTENIIGSYELHDFFLWYFLRYAETPENLLELADAAFAGKFSREEISRTLEIFMRRFFTQQFKRNAAPEGPAVNEVSLGGKSAWRMPSDAALSLWQ